MAAVDPLPGMRSNGHSRHPVAHSMDAADFVAEPAARLAVRLNLGAGDTPLEGYINLDRKQGQEIFPLTQYADDSVDEVRASHVLEHFSHRDVSDVLREWRRVLKPGGVLKVAVPNFEWIARQYLAGHPVNVQGYVMGGHADANDHHGAIFDREELSRELRASGFYDIRPWRSDASDCSRLPVSLNLQGRKKGPLPKMKIAGAMSVPRLGFQDNFFCWAQALLPLGITPAKYDGAFWGQCLERVMTVLARDGADYILTVDYDSVFTREHVEHLIRLAADHPEADAIAPVQLMRSGDTLLSTITGADGKPTRAIAFDDLHERELIPACTAHFGLTLIRVEALRQLPHPWFLGVPNAQGEWGDGRTDDDTYFWRKWREAGRSLFIAPHVVLGHGQFMISWPGRNMEPVYQNPKEFWESGIPEGAWR